MVVAITASLLGLVVVLLAYYRDEPVEQREVIRPSWGMLPDPGDVGRTAFPLAHLGYDPATVEAHFEALNSAYADLLSLAPPDVVARARQRAALRHGMGPRDETLDRAPNDVRGHVDFSSRRPPATREGADAEALRAEAALADLDSPHSDNIG
ncbi:MAG: hypothetical protein GEU74_02005 [Nitriliruptorales bacterium]|nr:hypothetical protein [Nitriliruptorales bacterium]